jgi:hypothetical protein
MPAPEIYELRATIRVPLGEFPHGVQYLEHPVVVAVSSSKVPLADMREKLDEFDAIRRIEIAPRSPIGEEFTPSPLAALLRAAVLDEYER